MFYPLPKMVLDLKTITLSAEWKNEWMLVSKIKLYKIALIYSIIFLLPRFHIVLYFFYNIFIILIRKVLVIITSVKSSTPLVHHTYSFRMIFIKRLSRCHSLEKNTPNSLAHLDCVSVVCHHRSMYVFCPTHILFISVFSLLNCASLFLLSLYLKPISFFLLLYIFLVYEYTECNSYQEMILEKFLYIGYSWETSIYLHCMLWFHMYE